MSFKFMSNKIDTRTSVPSLLEVVKLANTKKALASSGANIKTASSVKTAEMPDFIKKKIEESKAKKDGKEEDEDGDSEKSEKKDKKPFEEKGAKSSAANKVAEKEEGEESGQLAPKANPTNEPKKPEGAKGTNGKSSTKGEGESSGQLDVEPLHQEGESTGQKPAGLDTQKCEGKPRFVKIAELTGKQKEFLRKTWSLYWPKSFIDALLA